MSEFTNVALIDETALLETYETELSVDEALADLIGEIDDDVTPDREKKLSEKMLNKSGTPKESDEEEWDNGD